MQLKQKHNTGSAITMFFCKLAHWISSLEDVVSNNPLHKIHLLAFFVIKPKFTYVLCLAMIATFQSWLIWPCIDRGLLRSSKIHQFRSPGPPSSPTDYVLRLGINTEFRNTKIPNAENICCFENVCCFCISWQSFLRQFRSPWPPSSPTDNHYVLRLGNNAEFRFVISKSWFSHNLRCW